MAMENANVSLERNGKGLIRCPMSNCNHVTAVYQNRDGAFINSAFKRHLISAHQLVAMPKEYSRFKFGAFNPDQEYNRDPEFNRDQDFNREQEYNPDQDFNRDQESSRDQEWSQGTNIFEPELNIKSEPI